MDPCSCDYDPPEFAVRRNIKAARKPHQCEECGRTIAVGEPYEYTSGKWEGWLNQFHVCAACVELRNWAIASVPCFCWAYGNLHEDVKDMVHEVAPQVPGFFFEFGRRMVKIRQRKALTSPPGTAAKE